MGLLRMPLQAGAACRAAELTDDGADAVELRADMAPLRGDAGTDAPPRASLADSPSSPVLPVGGAAGHRVLRIPITVLSDMLAAFPMRQACTCDSVVC